LKISLEKNLAFADQPKPIPYTDIAAKVPKRKAVKPIESVQLDLKMMLPTAGAPKIQAMLDEKGQSTLRVANFKLGQHVMPPKIEAKMIPSLGAKSRTFSKPLVTEPFLPDHLDLRTAIEPLATELQVTPLFRGLALKEERKYGNLATTVFAPDERRVFNDTHYPWCTCGRVDSPNGQGSGVMVGPRHLLTAAHMVQWLPGNTTGWIRFRPAYFAPSAPFGEAYAVLTYYKSKVSGPTIDWYEGMYDYVVCVLDRYIGNWTGWMGAKGYTDAWDGGSYWSHIGYPGDITSGNRPIFQGGISLDGIWWEPDSHETMSHRGDVWPGQSGGPFFGWWTQGPYAVGVQSSHDPSQNNASGGQDMVDLVIRARNEHP
jgi:V8-like Glu-specific endopeptidase